jgi:hypothetical protein
MNTEKKPIAMPEGPSLDALLRRLLEIPTDFLLESEGSSGTRRSSAVNVSAVVHDVVAMIFDRADSGMDSGIDSSKESGMDSRLDPSAPSGVELATAHTTREAVNSDGLERFQAALESDRQGRAAGFALLLAWLLADPWFRRFAGKRVSQKRVWSSFTTLAVAHGAESSASEWHGDPKRREEIVRSMLATLELIPEGETEAQADDRLTRVSSAQRKRLLAAAREAEARAEVVREALAAKAAQEAADKYTRE